MSSQFTTWKKAQRSTDGGSGCMEWSFSDTDDKVAFRDSKLGPGAPQVVLDAWELECFLDAASKGEIKRPVA